MDPNPKELFLDTKGLTFALQILQNTGKLKSTVSYSYILTYSLLGSKIFQEPGPLENDRCHFFQTPDFVSITLFSALACLLRCSKM
jgi:hypothetical protein